MPHSVDLSFLYTGTSAGSGLTFDFHKVGCYEQRYQGTAALAVHGHTERHALAHNHCPMHQDNQQRHNRI